MTDEQDSSDEDFVLDLFRGPAEPSDMPDKLQAMRARRVRVATPTGVPSVQEVLLNPATDPAETTSTTAVRRLMRVQLRLAVSLMASFFGLVVAVNIAFHFSPALATMTVATVPLQWLFPAVVFIPLLIFLGWFYVRRAASHEQQVQHSSGHLEETDR